MHLRNINLLKKAQHDQNTITQAQSSLQAGKDAGDEDSERPPYVTQFGFHETTCCGYLPQDNEWCDDWVVSVGKCI